MIDNPQVTASEAGQSHVDESRRKRRQKLLIPSGKNERMLYLNEIAKRLVPGVEFFVLSLAAGLVIALGILLDSPAMLVLGALLAPFMSPAVGLGFSTVIGSVPFFLRSTGALIIGAFLVFLSGALGGWVSRLFLDLPQKEARRFTNFTIPDFLLLTVGTVLAIYLTMRVPKQRSFLASVPLAYEIYVPVVVAGFGLTAGAANLFPQALKIALVNIAWVILVGAITLAVLKLHPINAFGYMLTALVIGTALYGLVISSALGTAVNQQMESFVTLTPREPTVVMAVDPPIVVIRTPTLEATAESSVTPLPTNTLAPSRTPTITITPKPTPVWAKIYAPDFNGVSVRKTPGYDGERLTYLDNEQLIQVLPDVQLVDGVYWAHVLLDDGTDGWMVGSVLITATPAA